MTITPLRGRRGPASGSGARRQLKSPLAAPGAGGPRPSTADPVSAVVRPVPLDDREATLADFEGYLRTVNNRDGRPYEEKTIIVYLGPAKNQDTWMTANGIEGDFTEADAATLNRLLPGARPGQDAYAAAEPASAVQLPGARARASEPVHRGRPQPVRRGEGAAEDPVRRLRRRAPRGDRRRQGPGLRDRPGLRDHPDPAAGGHPAQRTARHGDEHAPCGPDQKPGVPPRAAQGSPRRRRGPVDRALPVERTRAGHVPAGAPVSSASFLGTRSGSGHADAGRSGQPASG